MIKLNKKITLIVILLISSFHITSPAGANSAIKELNQLVHHHQGKVIYLDFWASWCSPCKKSFPWLNTMLEKYQQQGFVVLSVNLDSDKKYASNFLQQTPALFSIIYDSRGRLAEKYQLKGMPSSFLFDRRGQLLSRHSGFNDKKKFSFEQQIQKALASN